jgi:hypothetical protein
VDFGETTPKDPTILLPDSNGDISVEVHHVHMMPDKKPVPHLPAPHFSHYYVLTNSNNVDDPELLDPDDCEQRTQGHTLVTPQPAERSMTLYSCMVSAGDL